MVSILRVVWKVPGTTAARLPKSFPSHSVGFKVHRKMKANTTESKLQPKKGTFASGDVAHRRGDPKAK